jgi:hypothetical protein
MTNTLCVQRKFICNRSNLPRSNSVPNYTPNFVIPPNSLFNNLLSISSSIIFDSAPIISGPSIVPAINPSSIVPNVSNSLANS